MDWLRLTPLFGLLFLCACCVDQAEGSSPSPVVRAAPVGIPDVASPDASIPDATTPDATIGNIARELESIVKEDDLAQDVADEDGEDNVAYVVVYGERKDEGGEGEGEEMPPAITEPLPKGNGGGGGGGGGGGLGSAPADFDEPGPAEESEQETYKERELKKLRRTTKRLEKTSKLQGQLIKAYEQKATKMNKDLDRLIRQLEEEQNAPSPVE